jgi:hypothetical protein
VSADDEVRGLNLVRPGSPADDRVARIRDQLKLADAWIKREQQAGEPPEAAECRRLGEQMLDQRRYEDAEEAFLDAIDRGLAQDHFNWLAAVNLVNCHLFLRRLDDADATAAQLAEMYAAQPEHPLHYLTATQRGAIAAERWGLRRDPADAEAARGWAQRAYDWQVRHRGAADGLRAYNLVAATLRLEQRQQALALCRAHEHDDDFQSWCRQGEHAAAIAELVRAAN